MTRYLVPILLMVAIIGCGGPSDKAGGPPPGPGGPGQQAGPGGPGGPPPDTSPAARLDRTMKELTERLKLKPDQVGPVRAILEQDQKKREAIQPDEDLSDPRLTMAKLFKAFQKLDQETKKALSKVLTPDQLAEYDEFKDEQRKRLVREQSGPPQKGPGGKRPPDDARGPSRR